MESACETWSYFRTGVQFLPTLTKQRHHAREHGQAERAELFDRLIQRVETDPGTNRADHMPKISLDHSDAIELAELLSFLADWLSDTHTHTLTDSLTTFVGHPPTAWTNCAPTSTDSCS